MIFGNHFPEKLCKYEGESDIQSGPSQVSLPDLKAAPRSGKRRL